MNNNTFNNNFQALDLITIIGFLTQIQNIKQDAEEKDYIHEVIRMIAVEIQRLHKENDRIEAKIDTLLKILKEKVI